MNPTAASRPVSLPPLPHQLERTVIIHATPETVFRYFTDSSRFAKWWGPGSTVEPRPGGNVFIRHPEGTEAAGEVLEIDPPRRFVFTYGFVSGKPIAIGTSRVTIALERERAGTRLQLTHELADAAARDEHVQGWRFQLSVFANVVADEVAANAAGAVDGWFDAWAESDAAARTKLLASIALPEVRFHDRYSNLSGLEDVMSHITAAQRFMPGIRLRRAGDVRHCQGMVLCDWIASNAEGRQLAQGSNVFVLGPTGQIEWVTGFWPAPGAPG